MEKYKLIRTVQYTDTVSLKDVAEACESLKKEFEQKLIDEGVFDLFEVVINAEPYLNNNYRITVVYSEESELRC